MISNRLQSIVDILKEENEVNCHLKIADIGSDHGYLLISLARNGIGEKLFGVENKEGPFTHLKTNILTSLKEEQRKHINVSFSSGLDEVSDDFNTIVIAGMGFLTIKSIIDKYIKDHDNLPFETFVFDSHTMTPELRMYMHNLGYNIKKEVSLYDKKVFYEIIMFKKAKSTDDIEQYDDLDYKYGPLLRLKKNDDFIKYYSNQISKLEEQLKTIKFDENTKNKKANLLNEIKSIIS